MEPLKILVVDDEEGILEVFRAVLEEMGHSVQVAASGEAGLEALERHRFDLAFLDIKLPGISGIEVLKKVRAGPDGPRVVMITGVLDDDLYDLSIYSRHAANGFITKPCSFQSIEDCVRKVMGEDAAFLRTPRDELRYAAAKVRRALEQREQTLAVAEVAEDEPLAGRLGQAFGYGGALRGTLAVHGDPGLRSLLRDDPDFTEEAGLYCELTGRLLAERVRTLFSSDWGVASLLVPGASGKGALAFLAVTHAGGTEVIRKQFKARGEELARDACHSALVHLHGALAD